MGFFGYWLVAKGATGEALLQLGLRPVGEGVAPGWTFAEGERDSPEDLDNLVAQASVEGGVAVGAYVYDSDFGVVVGGRGGRSVAEVVINADAARSYGLEPHSDIDAFARWTESAPHPLSPAQVGTVVDQHWVLAEEGVVELLELAGLPAPYDPKERPEIRGNVTIVVDDPPVPHPPGTASEVGAQDLGGYEEPLGSMREDFRVGNSLIAWREARFVPGIGRGFLGIWDRESPDAPAFRFPVTSRGESALWDELGELQRPLVLETLALSGLSGYIEPLGPRTIDIVGRRLSLVDARFVPGRGEGFVGVWDRENPHSPIAQLTNDLDGQWEAEKLAEKLLFDEELQRKDLPGLRLYLPRGEPRWIHNFPDDFRHLLPQGYWERAMRGPRLLTEESEDERWRPRSMGTGGAWYLYFFEPDDPVLLGLDCRGSFASVEKAQAEAARWDTVGDWMKVPEEVPRKLLATARWVAVR